MIRYFGRLCGSLCTLLVSLFLSRAIHAELPTASSSSSASATQRQIDQWRGEMRTALFVPEHAPALSPQSHGSFSPAPGVIAERVTYGTEFGMRVPAIVYRPVRRNEKGHLPALVVVNGHGGDKYSWYSFYTGILYARAGAVVLTYDPIGEGERNSDHRSGTRAHDRVVDSPHYAQRLSGLMITDVMQAVSYLKQRPDVDGNRIAIMGYSMGSFVSALTGAVDTRIRAVVLSGGGDLDGPNGYWDSSKKPMCQAIPYKALTILGDRPAVIYALNEKRGITYIINGSADTLVDIPNHLEPYFQELRQRVSALTGESTNIFDTYFIPNASHRPNWVTRPAALWLQDKFHFANWTIKTIEGMPETHISEWAAKNKVDMDKGYIQEDREGGVMALGNDIPNVPRDNLNTLNLDAWQKQKAQFVYEAWVKHAVAADGAASTNPTAGESHPQSQ